MGNDISISQAQQDLVDWVENGDACSLASAIVLGSHSSDPSIPEIQSGVYTSQKYFPKYKNTYLGAYYRAYLQGDVC